MKNSIKPLQSLLIAALFAFSPLQARDAIAAEVPVRGASWTADNGNGTFTNPLFYDEFSDPDLIRVGEDYYLAGTTMHAMPALVVLHSKDLVNWSFLSYAAQRLDLGPDFDLQDGKDAYGQGIWAPCIRYRDGVFYIFSNINGHGLQVFTSRDPAGPWEHRSLDYGIHDLSVLFDDDGRIYAVYNYDEVHMVELKPDLSGIVEGSDRVIIPSGSGMGEGHHFYKIGGKYYIISANYAPVGRMQCARADRPEGPYETVTISAGETFGYSRGHWCNNMAQRMPVPENGTEFDYVKPSPFEYGAVPLHQGGIVDLPNGDWWGFSMMDFMSVGRTTCLSPVTWKDGWPYFGLPGNPGRTPRTWTKPDVGTDYAPSAPYVRSDDFSGAALLPVWQWNHNPVIGAWSLAVKPGVLRISTLPASQLLWAKNTLTQRVIGPESTATIELDASGLKEGDVAGLGLLNTPCAWIGIVHTERGMILRFYKQDGNQKIDRAIPQPRVWLRAQGNFDADTAFFSFSFDGRTFESIGGPITLPYQLKTFQGTRFALFAYNEKGREGGYADFDNFRLDEPLADRSANLPLGKVITISNLGSGQTMCSHSLGMIVSCAPDSPQAAGAAARFRVLDRGKGRVALESMDGRGFVTVFGEGLAGDVRLCPQESEGSLFMWQDMLRGRFMLLSLANNLVVGQTSGTGEPYSARWPGTRPGRMDGTVLEWREAE